MSIKNSDSTFRFLLAIPFGFFAELFAGIAYAISGNQININFDFLKDDYE